MFKKILSITLLIIILLISFLTSKTKAAINQNTFIESKVLETSINEQEKNKLMKYDATTGKTEEVDIDDLIASIPSTYCSDGKIPSKTEPFNPLNNNETVLATYSDTGRISNVTEFPNIATCRLKYDDYGQEGIASGFLVGPQLLLTSAHCVMNINDNDRFFSDWVAYPAYNNNPLTLKIDNKDIEISSGWSNVYYVSGWKYTHFAEYDWCICLLNEPIGNYVGWYGTQSYGTSDEMLNLSIRVQGYPKEQGAGYYQYYSNGQISDAFDLKFYSTAKISTGYSGGPIMRTSDDYAVGVLRGDLISNSDTSVGTRITQHMIDVILANR